MQSNIIDGKIYSAILRNKIKTEVATLVTKHQKTPILAVILVGSDPASCIYVNNKEKACALVGIKSIKYQLNEAIDESELLSLLDNLNKDEDITGILVQLPLPKHIDTNKIINFINLKKDVDSFHPHNSGALWGNNEPNELVPCTALGIMLLIKSVVDKLEGKQAVVVGRSHIVGRPVAELLLQEHTIVTMLHSKVDKATLETICKQADILVAAIGKPNFLNKKHLKPNSIVIDVGINRLDDNKIVGDVDFADAVDLGCHITPVPGGVGPMTIACLLYNTVNAYKIQKKEAIDPILAWKD